ncbi:unnamed protein product [Amoebophrya sp. A120]|nr:unnamed protein product [Amoebophrya sp. A120]|eukprot:GSA120T00022355001.1
MSRRPGRGIASRRSASAGRQDAAFLRVAQRFKNVLQHAQSAPRQPMQEARQKNRVPFCPSTLPAGASPPRRPWRPPAGRAAEYVLAPDSSFHDAAMRGARLASVPCPIDAAARLVALAHLGLTSLPSASVAPCVFRLASR